MIIPAGATSEELWKLRRVISAVRELINERVLPDEVTDYLSEISPERARRVMPWLDFLGSKNRLVNPDMEFWLTIQAPAMWVVMNNAFTKPSATGAYVLRTHAIYKEVLWQQVQHDGSAATLQASAAANRASEFGQFRIRVLLLDQDFRLISELASDWASGGSVSISGSVPFGTAVVEFLIDIDAADASFVVETTSLLIDGSEKLGNSTFATWEDRDVAPPWSAGRGTFMQKSSEPYVLRHALEFRPSWSTLGVFQVHDRGAGEATVVSASAWVKSLGGEVWIEVAGVSEGGEELVRVSSSRVATDFYSLVYVDGAAIPIGTRYVVFEVHGSLGKSGYVDAAALNYGLKHVDQASEASPPIGLTVLWPFSSEPPWGWYIADGRVVHGIPLPDLRGRTVRGATADVAVGSVGGADSAYTSGSSETVAVASGSGAFAASPGHTHTVSPWPPYMAVHYITFIGG